jgi:hypothetical protein
MRSARLFGVSLLACLALVVAGGSASSREHEQSGELSMVSALDGTTWCAPDVHQRLAVDFKGRVTTKEGKDICLQFTQGTAARGYVMKVIWWNVAAGIHVEEWAVALPMGNGFIEYREATHPAEAGFPGISGSGELRLTDTETMEIHQVGQLADGSAAVFQTTLKRVRALPVIPLKRTYPKP